MSKKDSLLAEPVMGQVDFLNLKNRIIALRADMTFLQSLTDEDVIAMNKISDGDKVYIGDCLTEASNAQDLLPAYFSVEDIRKDDALNDELYELEDMLFELYQNVRRNRMAAAARAYSGVSTFYGLVKSAADAKVEKAIAMYKRLQDYHKKRTDSSKARRKKEAAIRQGAIADNLLDKKSIQN